MIWTSAPLCSFSVAQTLLGVREGRKKEKHQSLYHGSNLSYAWIQQSGGWKHQYAITTDRRFTVAGYEDFSYASTLWSSTYVFICVLHNTGWRHCQNRYSLVANDYTNQYHICSVDPLFFSGKCVDPLFLMYEKVWINLFLVRQGVDPLI